MLIATGIPVMPRRAAKSKLNETVETAQRARAMACKLTRSSPHNICAGGTMDIASREYRPSQATSDELGTAAGPAQTLIMAFDAKASRRVAVKPSPIDTI